SRRAVPQQGRRILPDSTNLSIPITPHDPKITSKTTTSDHHTTGNACASPAADAYYKPKPDM
ncbi:hypothetical protein, partial [Aidingimonas halophila]|uniref:hypothetical protein n=1 Tax=Aidingimonas halophila TaxID=574349 RepID=UPI001C3180BF